MQLRAYFTAEHVIFIFLATLCVCCAALGAGLTMGLLSLDTMKLKIKRAVGSIEERKAADVVLRILDNHHLLLCTLLIFNSAANEALPIFLDSLVPSYAAIILSVTLVLICGEVLPTAVFTGPNQLLIAAAFAPMVRTLMFVCYPIAWPMAKALDHILGYGADGHPTESGTAINIQTSIMALCSDCAKIRLRIDCAKIR
jgi:metal transporter CNNM